MRHCRFRETLTKYELKSKHTIYAIILDATGKTTHIQHITARTHTHARHSAQTARARAANCVFGAGVGVNTLDSTSIHLLEDLVQEYKAKKIRFLWANVKGSVRDTMNASGTLLTPSLAL